MTKKESDINKVERLILLFRPERYAYLAMTAICCIVLIIFAIILLYKGNWGYAIGMFGTSGVITLTMGRMLKMWNDVIKILFKTEGGSDV
jgi:hypothetical protein